jgi:hypothetical protein
MIDSVGPNEKGVNIGLRASSYLFFAINITFLTIDSKSGDILTLFSLISKFGYFSLFSLIIGA